MPVGSPIILKHGPTRRFSVAFTNLLLTPSRIDSSLALWNRADTNVQIGGARDLNGTNQTFSRADFSAIDLSTTDFSGSVALSRDATGTEVIVSKFVDASNYWALSFQAGNTLRFIAVVGGVTKVELNGTTAITDTDYHVVSWSVDRDSAAGTKIFLDGADDTSGTPTVSADSITNTGTFYVGEFGNGTSHFNGQLSNLHIAKSYLFDADDHAEVFNGGNGSVLNGLSSGLQAQITASWSFNEASGNAVDVKSTNDLTANNAPGVDDGPTLKVAEDSSANTNFGRLQGFSSGSFHWSTDTHNGNGFSLDLDGTDDYVLVMHDAAFDFGTTTDFSVIGRIKTTDTTASNTVIRKDTNGAGARWAVNLETSGKLTVFVSDGSNTATYTGDVVVTDGEWHSFAMTADRDGNLSLYVDGTVDGTPVSMSSVGDIDNTEDIRIGRNETTVYLDANIDDIRVFNALLSDDDVSSWHSDSSQATDNLVMYHKYDDGPQTSPVDGDPVVGLIDQSDNRLLYSQATAANRGLYKTDSNGINNQAVVEFDGTNDLYVCNTALTTLLHISLAVETGSTAFATMGDQFIFAISDTAAANDYFGVGIDSAGKVFVRSVEGGTTNEVTGDTVLSLSTAYVIEVKQEGGVWVIEVDGNTETLSVDAGSNTGLMNPAGADNMTLGALKHTSETDHFEGKIAEHVAYEQDITAANEQSLSEYMQDRYGIMVA